MPTLEVTDEMKQELVDNLKDPRYYRILINGYGGESSYMSVSKEAYEFWHPITEEHGDGDLCHYLVNAEDEDFEFDEIEEVPVEAQFMKDEDGDTRPWYEPPNEIEHTWGVNYDSAWISVDEVAGDEYGAEHLDAVIDREEVTHLVDRVYEDSGDECLEINAYQCCDEPDESVKYIAQMYSIEKGCFFDGIVMTHGDFDPRKLRIEVIEFLNGEDTITQMFYNGEEVENFGGDTIGKGYSAAVWAN